MKRLGAWIAVLAVGCASGGVPAGQEASPGAAEPGRVARQQGGRGSELVPAGHGTLRQDQFTISLRSGALLIKVTPLAESVIRLAAPDTYNRLHALAESRRAEAGAAGLVADPELFLVSFFSYQPEVEFQPQDLRIVQQGRLLEPRAILPLTPGWGKQRLQQQETQSAVYVFEGGLDYGLAVVVRYGLEQSGGWEQIIPVLEVERSKVRARASGG